MSEPLNLLIADDEEDLREMLRETIEDSGLPFRIFEAKDGRESAQVLTQNKIQMMITDVNMPNVVGGSLLNSLRAIPVDHLPSVVLVISGSAMDIPEGEIAGVTFHFMSKPLSLNDFVSFAQTQAGKIKRS